MPVEFRNIDPPTTWQIFPRHPAGAEYPDLGKKTAQKMKEGVEEFGVMLRAVILKRESNGMFVLDGWQMYQACIATGVKPEFVELVSGIDPARFVEIMNDLRRHETDKDINKRINDRRKKVRASITRKLAIGTPPETAAKEIAAEEGVDRATVYRDLAAPLPPRCERCEQKGENGDECAACQLLRMDWEAQPPEPPAPPEPDEPTLPTLDANFVIVPEHALDAFLVASDIGHICHEMDAITKGLVKIINDKIGSRFISATAAQRLADVRQHLWQSRPTHVCAYCQGQLKENCTACRGQGWQSAAAFAQTPKEFQDAMRNIGARNVPI